MHTIKWHRAARHAKAALMPLMTSVPGLLSATSRLYYSLDRSFHPLSPGALDAVRRALADMRDHASGPVGDYYEFGVFRGYTLWGAYQASRELGLEETHCYGFDSFKGLPPVQGLDRVGHRFFRGQFAASEREVRRHLTRRGVDWSRVTLIPGFFSRVLTDALKRRYPFRQVAVALIDCDLYASTRDVLRWLAGLLGDRAILLFDDWTSFGQSRALGQQRAFAEFRAAHPDYVPVPFGEFGAHGMGFVLTRGH